MFIPPWPTKSGFYKDMPKSNQRRNSGHSVADAAGKNNLESTSLERRDFAWCSNGKALNFPFFPHFGLLGSIGFIIELFLTVRESHTVLTVHKLVFLFLGGTFFEWPKVSQVSLWTKVALWPKVPQESLLSKVALWLKVSLYQVALWLKVSKVSLLLSSLKKVSQVSLLPMLLVYY